MTPEEKFPPERILDDVYEDPSIREYTSKIVELEQEFAELEKRTSDVSVGYTGLSSSREFTDLERQYQCLVDELMDLRTATLRGSLEPVSFKTDLSPQNHEFERAAMAGEFDEHLDRLDRLASRTGQRLTSRRTSANTRLGLTISVIAVVLSTISIIPI